jgi:hypothetical protein
MKHLGTLFLILLLSACTLPPPEGPWVDPLSAQSEQESRWLVRHGYPTRQEEQRLKALGMEQLYAEAKTGNVPANVVYGYRVALQPGRFYDGLGHLRKLAVKGKLYAYYGISEAYWDSSDHRSIVDSAAYLHVAYLLGDKRAKRQAKESRYHRFELSSARKRGEGLLETFAGDVKPSPRPVN